MSENVATITVKNAFPLDVTVGDVTVILNADGTYRGSADKLAAALATVKGPHTAADAMGLILAWTVLRAMQEN